MTAQQPAKAWRFGELDAYRGIAALLIIIYHAYDHAPPYPGTPVEAVITRLWLAVGWFFTLSGFVIFLPYARAALAGQRGPDARGFLVRRLLRVVPLYWTALLLLWLVGSTGGAWERRDLLLHLTFTQVYDPQHYYGILAPAWSLAVEVHFYLLVAVLGPALCRCCARVPSPRGRSALLLAALAALFIAGLGHKWRAPRLPDPWLVHSVPVDYLDTFALGMALAVVVAALPERPRLPRWTGGPLRLAGLAMCGLHLLLPALGVPEQRYMQLPASLGFTLMLASTVLGSRGSRWERLLRRPALVWAGTLSYGIYIWHVPLIKLLDASWVAFVGGPFLADLALLTLLTLLLAALGYRYVERPAMQLRRSLSGVQPTHRPHAADEPRLALPNQAPRA